MASIYDLKPQFQALLRPLVGWMHAAGITPNAITAFALALSIVTGMVIIRACTEPAWWLLVPVALFLRMALNALDGMMAREYAMSSPLGLVLNELGDVISDTFIFLPLGLHTAGQPWPVVLFAILAIFSEFAGLLGIPLCGDRMYQGPMGKSDRAFAVGLLAVLLFCWPDLRRFTSYYFLGLSLLLVLSIRNRVQAALARASILPSGS